jgi:hypothetical protein
MKIKEIESVPLISFDLKKIIVENYNFEIINDEILNNNLLRRSLEKKNSKYEDRLMLETEELDNIKNFLTKIVSDLANKKMKCDAIWTIVLEKNESVSYHSHKKNSSENPNDLYSIALYTKVPEDSADIVFFATAFNTFEYCIRVSPTQGMLLVFNSAVPHMSTAHMSDDKRIVISANFSPDYIDIERD